jgi:hypothetical protein
MKKPIFSIGLKKPILSIGLALTTLSGFAQIGAEFRPVATPFINWGGNLYLSNNSTYIYGYTNFVFRRADLYTNVTSRTVASSVTNTLPSGTTVTNSFYYPNAVIDVPLTCDAVGQAAPAILTFMLNDTNWVPQMDVQNLTNIVAPFSAVNASNVNTDTFYFAPIYVHTNAVSTNWFSIVVQEYGTDTITYSTNVTSLITGAKGLRLQKVVRSSVTTTTPAIINQVYSTQFRP